MTRIIYNKVEFETNGDLSRFQLNFQEDSYSLEEVNSMRERFMELGFPVNLPAIPEPYSIVFVAEM